jgi:hypothetical protein
MDAERLDIRTYKQASLAVSATLYQDSTTLVNLTNYTATMRIMDRRDGNVLATLSNSSGITLGGAAGTLSVSQTSAQVQAWGISQGAYDLKITSASGKADMVLYGDITVVAT